MGTSLLFLGQFQPLRLWLGSLGHPLRGVQARLSQQFTQPDQALELNMDARLSAHSVSIPGFFC